MENNVFSDYEVRKLVFNFGPEKVIEVPCVGSVEEELEVLTITKKCRGVDKKTRARGKGTGTLKISAHVPNDVLGNLYAMINDGLIDGVRAYGQNSMHKEFVLTADIFDEDGDEKYKAYPRCLVQSNLSRKTENGAEEVAEMEIEISVMPDDDGNCLYEAIVSELKDDTAKKDWLTKFKPSMVKPSSV